MNSIFNIFAQQSMCEMELFVVRYCHMLGCQGGIVEQVAECACITSNSCPVATDLNMLLS